MCACWVTFLSFNCSMAQSHLHECIFNDVQLWMRFSCSLLNAANVFSMSGKKLCAFLYRLILYYFTVIHSRSHTMTACGSFRYIEVHAWIKMIAENLLPFWLCNCNICYYCYFVMWTNVTGNELRDGLRMSSEILLIKILIIYLP